MFVVGILWLGNLGVIKGGFGVIRWVLLLYFLILKVIFREKMFYIIYKILDDFILYGFEFFILCVD